jgi:hypothetical protein
MLTVAKLATLKPRSTIYRVADAAGLCIEVRPDGGRSWRYRYRFAGIARMLSLGTYPQISLAEARRRRDEARTRLQTGQDPSSERRAEKVRAQLSAENTFGAIAEECLVSSKVDERFTGVVERRAPIALSAIAPAANSVASTGLPASPESIETDNSGNVRTRPRVRRDACPPDSSATRSVAMKTCHTIAAAIQSFAR